MDSVKKILDYMLLFWVFLSRQGNGLDVLKHL